MPPIVYTVCTLNYLAYAKAMAYSVLRHNPDYRIIVGLVDKQVDLQDTLPFEIVEAEQVIEPSLFQRMHQQYTLLELSCAFKPIFAEYIIKQYDNVQKVIYLDIDILAFSSFSNLEQTLETASFVLTPHILSPLSDTKTPQEESFLNAGVYNAGFFAFRNNPEAVKLLAWWRQQLEHKGFLEPKNGLFADQIWLNFMPLFFENVLVETNMVYNVAYWNLHERKISKTENGFFVNETTPLVFFHFSGYRLDKPDLISVHQNRFSFENNPAIKSLFEIYHEAVLDNGLEKYQHLPNAYIKTAKRTPLRIAQFLLLRYAKRLVNYLEKNM